MMFWKLLEGKTCAHIFALRANGVANIYILHVYILSSAHRFPNEHSAFLSFVVHRVYIIARGGNKYDQIRKNMVSLFQTQYNPISWN